MFQTQTFPFPKTVSLSCLRQGTLYHSAVIKYFYFTIPFPLLGRVTPPCATHYWVDMSMAHLKISSVLCSNTRFVFPLRSSSCKAPGSASGIRISVNSLQLKSTNCSSNKQHDKENTLLLCHVISYSHAPYKYHTSLPLIVFHTQVMKMDLLVRRRLIYKQPAIVTTPILKD